MKKTIKRILSCCIALLMIGQLCMFASADEETYTITLVKNYCVWTPPGMDTTWSNWLNEPETLVFPSGSTLTLDEYNLFEFIYDVEGLQNGTYPYIVYPLEIKPTYWQSSYNSFIYHDEYEVQNRDDTLYAHYTMSNNGLMLFIYWGEGYWTHKIQRLDFQDHLLMTMDPEWTYTVDGIGPAYQLPGEEDIRRDGYVLDGWTNQNGGTLLQKDGKWYYVFDPVTSEMYHRHPSVTPVWKRAAQDQISVTIGDQIGVNLLLDLDTRNAQNVTVVYKDLNGDEQRETFTDFASLPQVEGDLYKIQVQIAPAQIADSVTVYIDGERLDACVKDYCNSLIAGGFEPEVAALAQAVLDYGQAANNFFDYTDETISAVTDLSADDAKAWTPRLSDTTGKIRNVSFMALTKPEFRFYMQDMTEAEAAALNSRISVSGVNGAAARFVKNLNGAILLEVTGVLAEEMDKTITVAIDGLGTITFAGNDFAKLMADNSATEALGAALYAYGEAAKACFRVPTVGDDMEVNVGGIPDDMHG